MYANDLFAIGRARPAPADVEHPGHISAELNAALGPLRSETLLDLTGKFLTLRDQLLEILLEPGRSRFRLEPARAGRYCMVMSRRLAPQ